MDLEYVEITSLGERSCTMRWDHQFEKTVKVNDVLICEACYTGANKPLIPIPAPGQPLPTEPPKDAAADAEPIPATTPTEPETDPIQSDVNEPVERD